MKIYGGDGTTTNDPEKSIPIPKDEDPLFGGLDLAKSFHSSALQVLKLKEDVLLDEAYKIWPHVNYATVSKDVHRYYKQKYPMHEIGFDHSGVGQAAIELFDTITLPMVPIETTNKFKVDHFNAAQILVQVGQLKLDRQSPIIAQWEGQEAKTNRETRSIKYPHGSVPNDLLMALLYAIAVALPFINNSDVDSIITCGTGGRKKYDTVKDTNKMLDEIMGITNEGTRYVSSINKLKFQRRQHTRLY